MTLGRAIITEQCQSDSLSISGGHDALAHYLEARTHYFWTDSRPACPRRTGNSGFRVLAIQIWRKDNKRWNLRQRNGMHLESELLEKGSQTTDGKPRHAASDRVVYLAVAPPIEPVIYSKEIFIPSDLILMIINRLRPLSVPLSGVYSRS